MVPGRGLRHSQERKQFFFVKKSQKTFALWDTRRGNAYAKLAKVFASFFKKKRFPVTDVGIRPKWA
jgi:hypothetical protein